MKTVAIPLSVAFGIASAVAFAQSVDDPMAQLRACSLKESAERLKCLDELSHNIGPAARPPPEVDNWIVSETTSPVDYTPIVAARTVARGGSDGSAMQLSIYCRNGRTEPAKATNTPFPIASMAIRRYNLQRVRHRLERAPRSKAMWCACYSRSQSKATSPSTFRAELPPPLTVLFRSVD
jgi:hypothetical protein